MKYVWLLLLVLSVNSAVYAAADDTTSQADRIRIYSGFRFGFGGAKQRNTYLNKSDGNFAINPNMGAVLWLRFHQHFGLMLEGNYSLKGSSFRSESSDTTFIFRRRFHYLEFPVLIHASIGSQKFTEFIEFGIASAYISGGYDQQSAYLDKQPVDASYTDMIFNKPLSYPVKRFDISMVIGAGLSVKVGPGMLHSGFRTFIGLMDIYKDERIGYIDRPQRQFNFMLQFGYLWHVKSIR